jgi:hypothetical protein
MDHITRLTAAFALQATDRPPILGGWLAAPGHIQALTGCSDDDYWADPFHWGMEAERALGSDGVIGIFVPVSRGAYRCVDGRVLADRARYTVDTMLAEIAALPEPEQMRAAFDEEREYADLKGELNRKQAQAGEMLWRRLGHHPQRSWYSRFGYENALMPAPGAHRKPLRPAPSAAGCTLILRARASARASTCRPSSPARTCAASAADDLDRLLRGANTGRWWNTRSSRIRCGGRLGGTATETCALPPRAGAACGCGFQRGGMDLRIVNSRSGGLI